MHLIPGSKYCPESPQVSVRTWVEDQSVTFAMKRHPGDYSHIRVRTEVYGPQAPQDLTSAWVEDHRLSNPNRVSGFESRSRPVVEMV
jgi:hypothetical protein